MNTPTRRGALAEQWLGFLGGPAGHYALVGRQPWWTRLRVLLALGTLSAIAGYATKFRCIQSLAWDDDRRQYASACYTDLVVTHRGTGTHNPTRGGVVVDLVSLVPQLLTRWIDSFLTSDVSRPVFFTCSALLLACIWLLIIDRLHGVTAQQWALTLVALSPIVWFHAYTDWTLVSVLLAVLATTSCVRASSPRNFAIVGVILALTTMPWAGLLLVAITLWLVATGIKRTALVAVWGGWAAGVALVVFPLSLLFGQSLPSALGIGGETGPEWITLFRMVNSSFGITVPGAGLLGVLLGAFVVVAVAWFFLTGFRGRAGGPQPQDLHALCFVLLLGYLVASAWWRPQDSLMLLPFAVLGVLPTLRCSWTLIGVWMVIEAFTWPLTTWHMMGTNYLGLPVEIFNLWLCLRLVFLAWLAWQVLCAWAPPGTHRKDPAATEEVLPGNV